MPQIRFLSSIDLLDYLFENVRLEYSERTVEFVVIFQVYRLDGRQRREQICLESILLISIV